MRVSALLLYSTQPAGKGWGTGTVQAYATCPYKLMVDCLLRGRQHTLVSLLL
jgi:hypothetical protein